MIPNRFLIASIILFLTIPIFSQTFIGLKGGINQSKSTFYFNIDPSLTTNQGDLNGFYFGIPLEFEINDFFNFIPELALASEGSVLSVQVGEEALTYNNAIIYTKLPLLIKLKLLKSNYYEFGLIGGFVPAMALDVKSFYFTSTDLRSSINVPIDLKEAGIRRFDLGFSLGFKTEKVIAKGWKIILDLRYNLGLLDIETHSDLTTTTESFNLTVGILTPLFRRSDLIKI